MITVTFPLELVLAAMLPLTFVLVCGAVIRAGKLWIERAPDAMTPRYWMD